MRQLATYAFSNAKVRAMLSYLIEPAVFAGLLETKNIYELIEALKSTPYRSIFEGLKSEDQPDLTKLERRLLLSDLDAHRKAGESLGRNREKELVSLLAERYEIDEIKSALRLWYNKSSSGVEEFVFSEHIIHNINFRKILSSHTIEEIILLLDRTPYKEPLMKAREKFKETSSLFYPEASLDVDYFNRLIAYVATMSPADKKIAGKIIGVEIDIENIQWLVKLRKYYSLGLGEMLDWFIPGGSRIDKNALREFYTTEGVAKVIEGLALGPYMPIKNMAEENIALIGNFLYEVLLKEVKRALAGFPFTIGTILGYLILKRRETKNIVSLLYAKSYGWKKDDVSRLLNI